MELDPAKIDAKHLKVSFLPREGEMSRRDLLLGFLKPHYEIVPAVETERCMAWRGCSLCVSVCPQEAISLKEAAVIDKDKCTACGACLPSCPNEAITSPLLDPAVFDALLQSLLCRDQAKHAPKIILILSDDTEALLTPVRDSLPLQLLELKLPCIAALSPWLLLRSFDLGADGVVVIPCGPNCRHRCQPERWQLTMAFVQALLSKLGIEQERVRVFSFSREESQPLAWQLSAFVEEVKGMGPTALRNGGGKEERLTLVALLKYLGQRFKLDGSYLSGDEIPFGLVIVEAGDRICTLCGACPDRCPTAAITTHEGADLSQLLFDHSRCIDCEACVEVCPEKILQVEKTLNFSLLGKTIVLAEDRMALCRRCGREIAPLTMLRKIQGQLAGKKISGLAEYCANCRIFGLSDAHMAVKAGHGFADVERERGKIQQRGGS